MGTDHNDTILLFTFLFLALTVWGTSLFESLQLPVLHFTVVMVAFGVACGGLVRLFYPDEDFTNETFNDGVFFRAILPPIIFAAGYSLDARTFFSNWWQITLLGFGCTVITWLSLAFFGLALQKWGWARADLTSTEFLILGAVLSSTDTIAVVSLLQPEAAPTLYCILAGEGVSNDGVSVVLFRTVTNTATDDTDGTLDVGALVAEFCKIFSLSVILGVAAGMAASLTAKYTRKTAFEVEVTILVLWGLVAYFLAEAQETSGIISLFVCGIVMGRYATQSLSKEAQTVSLHALNSVSYGLQALIYTSIGFFSWMYLGDDFIFTGIDGVREDVLLGVGLLGALVVLRGVVVFSFMSLANYTANPDQKLSYREMGVIWFGGIIRGVLAFALSVSMSEEYAPQRDGLVTTTYVIVIITIVVGGIFAKPVFRVFNVPLTVEQARARSDAQPEKALVLDGPPSPADSATTKCSCCVKLGSALVAAFVAIERKFMQPVFGK
eukprot:gene15948-24392_t